MRTFNGIDELQAAVGQQIGWSDWHEVTQDAVDQFADATGDHQWIHVDVDRAKQGPFGGTIAHGYLTLSLIPMFSFQVWKLEGVAMAVNYGTNKVRFPSPVPVGSRVRAGFEVASVTPSDKGTQVVMTVTVEREGGDRPACVAETVAMLFG